MVRLSREKIMQLLRALDEALSVESVVGEVYLVGGAVMCLVFDQRADTLDVDAWFHPPERIRRLAQEVGAKLGVAPDWLNDAVKGFMSERGAFQTFLDLGNLKVFAAVPEYLLAMKCLAFRLGPEFHDEADVRFLLRYLNLETVDQAKDVLSRYYPLERFPVKALFALAELLDARS